MSQKNLAGICAVVLGLASCGSNPAIAPPSVSPPPSVNTPPHSTSTTALKAPDTRSTIVNILVQRLKKNKTQLTNKADLVKDLGADSLDMAEILMDIEDAFEIRLDDANTENLHSISDLIAAVDQQLAAKKTSNSRPIAAP